MLLSRPAPTSGIAIVFPEDGSIQGKGHSMGEVMGKEGESVSEAVEGLADIGFLGRLAIRCRLSV